MPAFSEADARVTLAHGAGMKATLELIKGVFLPSLGNEILGELGDSAVVPRPDASRIAFTVDAFVVDPPIFPGGDVGYLAVCGTVNDLAVAGADPLWIAWALIIEEGTPMELVRRIVDGARRALREAGVEMVAGDTKVVPRGSGDGVYVTCAGIGMLPDFKSDDASCRPGDLVLVSGPLGDHGASVMAIRHGLEVAFISDCAPVLPVTRRLRRLGGLRTMHDPTRGGLAATCHEVAERSGLRIRLMESSVPVRKEVKAVCDLLGLDPLYLACEGRVVAVVSEDVVKDALSLMGPEAAVVGRMEERASGRHPVVVENAYGQLRPLDLLSGEELPRIC